MTNASAPSSALANAEVLGQIGADRFCSSCRYNLIGQQIVREPVYGLPVARCPECGTIAAVGTHAASRWMSIWRVVLIALWFLLVISTLPMTGGVMTAMAIESNESASRDYRSTIHTAHRIAVEQAEVAAATPTIEPGSPPETAETADTAPPAPAPIVTPAEGRPPVFDVDPNGNIIIVPAPAQPLATFQSIGDFGTWWETVDAEAFLAAEGGAWHVIDSDVWWFIGLAIPLAMFPQGVVWSVLLLPHHRRRLPWWWLAMTVVAAGFCSIYIVSTIAGPAGWSSQAARQELVLTMAPLGFGVASVMLLIGMLLGRPIVRGLVRLMLPPRLRPGLALLWRVDDLPLPRWRPSARSSSSG